MFIFQLTLTEGKHAAHLKAVLPYLVMREVKMLEATAFSCYCGVEYIP